LRNSPPLSVLLVVLLLGLAVTYFVWPYLVAFLAILGAVQIIRAWQRNDSDRNSRR
jgi:hypothetical protein